MNLLIFLDLTYNPCKNVKFCSFQWKNVQFFIFTYNQGKIFLILPITKIFLILPITKIFLILSITGCFRKIAKNEEHKLPPEHTFLWRLA